MKDKKTYEAPAIEEQEINQFIVLEGTSPAGDLKDNLTGLGRDLGGL